MDKNIDSIKKSSFKTNHMGQIGALKKKKTTTTTVFGSSQWPTFIKYLTEQNYIAREESRQPLESVEMSFW